jgi:hypothetical protein
MCVYLCTLFKISERSYTIGKNLQLLQHKICIDLFCCSWNLSLPLDATVYFELTVCSADSFLFFFLTSLNTKELKLQCPSLNKHYLKEVFETISCIIYAFHWIIILRVFIESFIVSRDLRFSLFFKGNGYFFFSTVC